MCIRDRVTGGCDKVVFVGSTTVGRMVMKSAAQTLTPVVLELGGKDPFIVCDDADFVQVVPTALRGAFQSCGQNCAGAERFYVHERVHERFVREVVAASKVGDPAFDRAALPALLFLQGGPGFEAARGIPRLAPCRNRGAAGCPAVYCSPECLVRHAARGHDVACCGAGFKAVGSAEGNEASARRAAAVAAAAFRRDCGHHDNLALAAATAALRAEKNVSFPSDASGASGAVAPASPAPQHATSCPRAAC